MRVRVTVVAVENPSIKYSGCVSVALVIQNAKRTLLILLAFLSCQGLAYFSTVTHKERNFGKRLLNKKHVFRVSLQIFWKNFSF